jgi:hypothetical protein
MSVITGILILIGLICVAASIESGLGGIAKAIHQHGWPKP